MCRVRSAVVVTLAALLVSSLSVAAAAGPAVEQEAATSPVVWTAHAEDPPTTGAGLTQAAVRGAFDEQSTVLMGETLVVAIASPVVAARVTAGSGTPTERFFAAYPSAASLEHTNPNQQVDPKAIPLGPRNTTVLRDGPRTYLLVNTSRIAATRSGDQASIEPFDAFEFRFDGRVTEAEGGTVRFLSTPLDFDDSRFYQPLPPEFVELPVEVYAAERPATVRFETANRTLTAPVETIGQSSAALDLRNVSVGTNYTLSLVAGEEVVASRSGTIREPEAEIRNVTVTRADDRLRVNATVRLSHGGALLVSDEAGDRLEVVRFGPLYRTPAGPNETVRLSFRTRPTETNVEAIRIQAFRDPSVGRETYPNASLVVNVSNSTADSLARPARRSRGDRPPQFTTRRPLPPG